MSASSDETRLIGLPTAPMGCTSTDSGDETHFVGTPAAPVSAPAADDGDETHFVGAPAAPVSAPAADDGDETHFVGAPAAPVSAPAADDGDETHLVGAPAAPVSAPAADDGDETHFVGAPAAPVSAPAADDGDETHFVGAPAAPVSAPDADDGDEKSSTRPTRSHLLDIMKEVESAVAATTPQTKAGHTPASTVAQQIEADDGSTDGIHLPIGYQLRDYTITSVLGQGGFGITYLARDNYLNRDVVIKENLPAALSNRDTTTYRVRSLTKGNAPGSYQWALNNFLNEARTLCNLNHPNIIKIHTAFSEMGTAYYVMPHISGVSLDKAPVPMPEEQVRPLLDSILDALEYLHSLDPVLLHRDIKPANILCKQDGTPILIDFGTARVLTEHSQTVIESAGYTPFEQTQTHGDIGPWSDVYALGGTIYYLVTGTKPMKSSDRMGRQDKLVPLAGRAELQQKYSQQLLCSIDKAMARWPEERWQSAKEWKQALNAPAATATTITAATEVAQQAQEELDQAQAEYNRQMEEYNRQMEEYNRQMAAFALAETQATAPKASENNKPEAAPAPGKTKKHAAPHTKGSTAKPTRAKATEGPEADIFTALDHDSWTEVMQVLMTGINLENCKKGGMSPAEYAEKKNKKEQIQNLLKSYHREELVDAYRRMQQGDYDAVCDYLHFYDHGPLIFRGKNENTKDLLRAGVKAGSEKCRSLLIDSLREGKNDIASDFPEAIAEAKQAVMENVPGAKDILYNLKLLFWTRRYSIILAFYMAYLLFAIFIFDSDLLLPQVLIALFCLVRQYDKFPIDVEEKWAPGFEECLWIPTFAGAPLMLLYGIILIVHACGSMGHADYTEEYTVWLAICITLACRTAGAYGAVIYGALSAIGLIGFCFLSPLSTMIDNQSALSTLCMCLFFFHIIPSMWGLIFTPILTFKRSHGILTAALVCICALITILIFE